MTNTAATVTYSTPLGGEPRVVLRRAILHAKRCPEDSVLFEAQETTIAVTAEDTVVGALERHAAAHLTYSDEDDELE